MAQLTNWTIPNSGGSAFRTAVNAALAALQSNSSGAAAPSPTVAGMTWFDTTTLILKRRNNANTAWVDVSFDTVAANTLRGNPTGSAAAETAVSMTQLRTMMGFSQSFSVGSSYQTLPGGLVMQFGQTGAIAAANSVLVTFPISFPTGVLARLAAPQTTVNNSSGFSVGTRDATTSTMSITNNLPSGSVSASWIVIGY